MFGSVPINFSCKFNGTIEYFYIGIDFLHGERAAQPHPVTIMWVNNKEQKQRVWLWHFVFTRRAAWEAKRGIQQIPYSIYKRNSHLIYIMWVEKYTRWWWANVYFIRIYFFSPFVRSFFRMRVFLVASICVVRECLCVFVAVPLFLFRRYGWMDYYCIV